MIETEQTVTVARSLTDTWRHASDFQRWAEIMPGYQSCTIEDADRSRWVLKVGVGAMVRTVTVLVHVTRWAGPERAEFTFRLEGDPVTGSGAYVARALDADSTEMALRVRVEGTGPLAPMWEAMGAPVLPKFARGFAEQLKARIEAAAGQGGDPPAAPGFSGWLRAWLRRIFGPQGEP